MDCISNLYKIKDKFVVQTNFRGANVINPLIKAIIQIKKKRKEKKYPQLLLAP